MIAQGLSNQRQGQIGVNVVERIVLATWKGRWQQIDGHNDDGVDGLIFLEKNGVATGEIIYAQVKCTSVTSSDELIRIPVKNERLSENLEKWKKVVGACIVIHVDPKNYESHWVDIRDRKAFTKSQIIIPKQNKFDKKALKEIRRLCGTIHRDQERVYIEASNGDFPHLLGTEHILPASRKLYRNFGTLYLANGARVRFLREGWRHITRRERSGLSRFQSLVLLGVVRKIIEATSEDDLDTDEPSSGNLAARAAVLFPFRHTGIVKVVLSKKKDENGSYYSFVTVYEPQRRRDPRGVEVARGALSR